jgi:hypothetical protein
MTLERYAAFVQVIILKNLKQQYGGFMETLNQWS